MFQSSKSSKQNAPYAPNAPTPWRPGFPGNAAVLGHEAGTSARWATDKPPMTLTCSTLWEFVTWLLKIAMANS